MKKNKKGFTLVELLASLVILGLLTLVAAPNIIGILSSTKTETYVTDATKLATLAEYRFRSDNNITRPTTLNQCIGIKMETLGTSEFKKPPYGGTYDPNKSFALVCYENVTDEAGVTTSTYVYYAQIIETIITKKNTPPTPDETKDSGIQLRPVKTIKQDQVNGNLTGMVEAGSTTIQGYDKDGNSKTFTTGESADIIQWY